MTRDFALPGTRIQYAPDRNVDIQHIKLDLEVQVERKRIEGTCTLTMTPIAGGVRWIALDAVELDIFRVHAGGTDLEFTSDGKLLRIDLGDKSRPGVAIDVAVDYAAEPRRGLYFVGPDEAYPDKPVQVWSQGQDRDSRYWFPCFDSPHEKATSELIAVVPKTFFALSNGTLVSDETRGGRRTLHWRFDHPHSNYLITLAAAEFAEIRDRWGNVDVTYYAQPEQIEDARRAVGRTPQMLELFSRLFGVPYPFEKYAQAFVADFIFGGMENTTATTLTDAALLDERAAIDHDVEWLISHELAHQWFGDLITCRDWGEGWLNEGFATYSEYLWREHIEGRDAAVMELMQWGDRYFAEDAQRYRRTVAIKLYDEPIDVFDHHLYDKGGRILHMLRQILGDEHFWAAIKLYLSKHRSGSVETRDLARAIEEATGRVLDWFFDQWVLKGSGHPELEVNCDWDGDRAVATFSVRQTHTVDASTPLFRLPTSVELSIAGRSHRVPIEIRDAQHTFSIPCDRAPTQAIFDPGKHLLARVTCKKSPALWIEELTGAAEAIDRIDAARELAGIGGRKATEALIGSLRSDAFWGVRAASATALGSLRTERARDALLGELPRCDQPRVRRAVAKALGEFRHDESAGAALRSLLAAGDESYFVVAEACLALGKTRTAGAPDVLRSCLDLDSYRDVIRQHALRGLAEARDYESIPLLIDSTRYGGGMFARRAAIDALATLARGRTDQQAFEIREAIEELLRDREYLVQLSAVEALATLGEAAAIPALRTVAESTLEGRLKRRCREVIRDLQDGRAQGQELVALRGDVERLQRELLGLRERLDAVEGSAVHARDSATNARPARRRKTGPRVVGGKKTLRVR